jgi:uncharacterized membrane protein YvbJ
MFYISFFQARLNSSLMSQSCVTLLNIKQENFNVCVVYLLDSQVYISGCVASLSTTIQLELPHVNILSKMDLVGNKKDVEEYVFFPSSFI